MSTIEGDPLMACLFDRQDMRLVNIKFFRGSADVIAEDDLRRESHNAIMQLRLNPELASEHPPVRGMKAIDVSEFVAKL